jgi:hypothetical protein
LARKSKNVAIEESADEVAYRNLVGQNFLPLKKIRPNRFLKDSHKHIDELAVGHAFLKALGLQEKGLTAGPHNLPPDLLYQHGDGLIGIENTSLGTGEGELESKKSHLANLDKKFERTNSSQKKSELKVEIDRTLGELRELEFWSKDFFLRRLRETILAKNLNRSLIEVAPKFEEIWLFISIHGANLTKPYVSEYLDGQKFVSRLFSKAWVKLEYDPELKAHPAYQLPISSEGVD